MSPKQHTFLEQQFLSMSRLATAQRGHLYRKNSKESIKQKFRCDLSVELKRLTEQYRNGISEPSHLANISNLADSMSTKHAEILNGSRFRIGSAQKALNLYLKYMWCIDLISTPPHCPFDYMILSRLPNCRNVKWTQLDSLPEYEEIVQHAKNAADGTSLAEWELSLYNVSYNISQSN